MRIKVLLCRTTYGKLAVSEDSKEKRGNPCGSQRAHRDSAKKDYPEDSA
jgi:hypothetical protein